MNTLRGFWFRDEGSFRNGAWRLHLVTAEGGSLCGLRFVTRYGCLPNDESAVGIQGPRAECKTCKRIAAKVA